MDSFERKKSQSRISGGIAGQCYFCNEGEKEDDGKTEKDGSNRRGIVHQQSTSPTSRNNSSVIGWHQRRQIETAGLVVRLPGTHTHTTYNADSVHYIMGKYIIGREEEMKKPDER